MTIKVAPGRKIIKTKGICKKRSKYIKVQNLYYKWQKKIEGNYDYDNNRHWVNYDQLELYRQELFLRCKDIDELSELEQLTFYTAMLNDTIEYIRKYVLREPEYVG